MPEKSIAFFDFDGTITTKDTMLELAKFSAGTGPYLTGMLLISPWLLAMKFGLVSKKKAKEKFLTHFFGGMPIQEFNDKCAQFTEQKMPGLIKKEAMIAIREHLNNNIPVVVVSASSENWVAPWCRQHQLQFICTKLQVSDNIITGRLEGENCNADEKVCRIKSLFTLSDYSSIYCYGDTGGDKQMLALATQAFFRKFKC